MIVPQSKLIKDVPSKMFCPFIKKEDTCPHLSIIHNFSPQPSNILLYHPCQPYSYISIPLILFSTELEPSIYIYTCWVWKDIDVFVTVFFWLSIKLPSRHKRFSEGKCYLNLKIESFLKKTNLFQYSDCVAVMHVWLVRRIYLLGLLMSKKYSSRCNLELWRDHWKSGYHSDPYW